MKVVAAMSIWDLSMERGHHDLEQFEKVHRYISDQLFTRFVSDFVPPPPPPKAWSSHRAAHTEVPSAEARSAKAKLHRDTKEWQACTCVTYGLLEPFAGVPTGEHFLRLQQEIPLIICHCS